MAKGNKTNEFWRYDMVADTWRQMKDVPAAPGGDKVTAGSDMVYVEKNGQGYLYLLKGQRCGFCRFNVAADSWEALPNAPAGAKGRWPDGSWLVYDRAGTIYAHKVKYHEFYKFDVPKDSWSPVALTPMPIRGPYETRKSGAGSCGAWHDTRLYALKGGNSTEFWDYYPACDSWRMREDIPLVGSTGKKKKVKAGADMVNYEHGNVPAVLLVLKGNKTNEFWMWEAVQPGTDMDASEAIATPCFRTATPQAICMITPNPVSGRRFEVLLDYASSGTALGYSQRSESHLATRLSIFDVLGRCRTSVAVDGRGSVGLDADAFGLSAGVYLVRVETEGHSASAKFVITR
jgi:hypothetical protein